MDTQNPIYNTYLSVDEIVYKNEKVKDFNIISTSLKDTLYFRSEFSRSPKHTPFAINFYHTLDMDKNSRKIAFMMTSTGWGGLEMNVLKIARSLTQFDYNITLITQEGSPLHLKGKDSFNEIIILISYFIN